MSPEGDATSGGTSLLAQRRLADYKHSRWTSAEGAPPIIYAITQDSSGYLILGSSLGLYRFDGVNFERINSRDRELARGRVMYLARGDNGKIWVAYETGAIATYQDGALRLDRSVPRTGLEPSSMVVAGDGTVWLTLPGTDRPYLRRQNGKWERIAARLDREDRTEPKGLFAEKGGAVWLETTVSLYRMEQGASRFTWMGRTNGRTVLSEDKQGQIWKTDDSGTRPFRDGASARNLYPTPPFRTWTAVTRFDRNGNLWIANGRGLFRVGIPSGDGALTHEARRSRVDGMTIKDGLTADTTTPLFEDREGNIWVGTTRGLDQFRQVSIINEPELTTARSTGTGLLAASDGTVYVGTTEAIYRVRPRARPELMLRAIDRPRMICEGADGEIWALAANAFVRIRGDEVARLKVPAAFGKPVGAFQIGGCALDSHGVLWVARAVPGYTQSGLYTYRRGEWRHVPLPESKWPMGLTKARDGRLLAWLRSGAIGSLDSSGQIAETLLTEQKFRSYPFVGSGNDRLIRDTSNGVVIGGTFGIARLKAGALQFLDPDRIPALAGPTDIVETPDGRTWVLSRAGIASMSTEALGRAFDNPLAALDVKVLNFDDGLPDVRSLTSQLGAIRGGDGRIWFNLVSGTVWIDPNHLVQNSAPPLVGIRNLVAGKQRYLDPSASITLARGTSSAEIHYVGLSYTIPGRVRFRYQLEGVDDSWVDAGSRREAFYTNLGPGTYRFRVLAANNDGVWSRRVATLEFTIPPTFIQSIWFKLLCVVALLFGIWVLVLFRTRAVRARLQARFDIQMAERESIARDLHDTLLQGVQGLTVLVQSAANGLSPRSKARQSIESALDRAEAVIEEGRDQLVALRSNAAPHSLSEALEDAARALRPGETPRVQITTEGLPLTLLPDVNREIYVVALEALRNAVRHAAASSVRIVLIYSKGYFCLSVTDDGIGIPADILQHGRDGHYGLTGMRERARQISSQIEIESRPAGGTTITLRVPARIAYEQKDPRRFVRRFCFWRKGSVAGARVEKAKPSLNAGSGHTIEQPRS